MVTIDVLNPDNDEDSVVPSAISEAEKQKLLEQARKYFETQLQIIEVEITPEKE